MKRRDQVESLREGATKVKDVQCKATVGATTQSLDSMRCYDEEEVEVVAVEAEKVEEEVERVDRVEEDDAAVDCFAR